MNNYIDGCHKQSEIHEAYPKQSNEIFLIIVNITVCGASVITQGREIGTYNETEANKSIEQNASEKIEQNAGKKIEQNVIK